jgi:NADPH2:quinone reductase
MSDVRTTMRTLEQPTLAGPQDMRLVTGVPVPRPGVGEVLVRVGAAGVNFADVMQTRGTYGNGPKAPYFPGFEAAGEVVELGTEVNGIEPGQHVVGAGYGAFAEYVVMSAAGTAPVPHGWSDEQALGLILNWATALAALRTLGRLTSGETVLVHAAAGAVGQAAVRMARHYGAIIIATASADKHPTVKALGADHLLDYRNTDVAAEVLRLTDGRGADLVLESVGGATFHTSLAAARRVTGRVVVFGLAAGEAAVSNWELNFRHQVQVIGLHIGVLAECEPQLFNELMAELATLREADVYPPGEPTVHDLADGPRVLAELEGRATIGKQALKP